MSRLEGVKEGDPVALYEYGALHRRYAGRTTATRVTIGADQFVRRTGYKLGETNGRGGWAEAWNEATHPQEQREYAAEAESRNLRRLLVAFDWRAMTIEQMRAVRAKLVELGLVKAD